MYRVLKKDLGKKPSKMMERHELTENHERMRAERSCHILNEIAQGTLPNLVFTNEKKFDVQQGLNLQNDRVWSSSSSVEGRVVVRRQNAQTFSGFTMEFPTRFSTITMLQRNPNLDSEEHSIFHKQRCMTCKELRPQSLGLFYLVHFGDKGLSYPSHFSRVPQSKLQRDWEAIPQKQIRAACDAFVNM
ncbi:hypothetical protein FHG87_005729 [Trinorchestia longiramus]|nr:hypothetical protein FHG87_005729 [Trinorchestia longiramus]